MGDITESTRRHYVGSDADKVKIPAGALARGDSYHANDKGKQYYWDGANWKTGLGYEYVPRLTAGSDKAIGDFPVKDAFQTNALDLSGIVPEGAVAVILEVLTKGTAADLLVSFRHSGVSTQNRAYCKTQVANIYPPAVHSIVPIDTDRLLDYYVQTNIDACFVTVIGWFI